MKRLRSFLNAVRGSGRRLIALCYAVFLAGSLLAVLFGIAEDGVRRLTGDVRTVEIPGGRADAFSLRDLEQDGMWYTALSVDPRMDLDLSLVSPDGAPVYVRRVTLYIEDLNMDPGEVCVFYKPYPNMEEYDAIYRVWVHKDAPNRYTFTLPVCAMYGIRIDPGIFAGLRFRLERVVLNEPRSLWDRLTPTRPYLLALAVVPLLAASALHWVLRAGELLAEKRRGKSKQTAGRGKAPHTSRRGRHLAGQRRKKQRRRKRK